MTKKEYQEQRNALLAETEALMAESKAEEASIKMTEIETLDNQWEEIAKANANLEALKENKEVLNIEEKNITLKGDVKTLENIKEFEKIEAVASPEYRNAFLKKLQGRDLTQQENALTGGSSAVPTETMDMIVKKLTDMVPLLNEIQLFRMPGNINIMVNTVLPGATLEAAGGAVTESNATLVEISLGGYNMNAFISIGADLSAMSIPSFEAWLTEELARSIAYKIEYYIINGDGNSAPKGIEHYVTTWDVSDGNAVDWASTALGVGDLDKAIGLIPAAYDSESKFLMSKKTFFNSVVNLTDTNNYPVVQREGNKFYVRGFEVVFSDQVALNDIFFGSLKRGMAGNLGVDIQVEKQRNLRYNAYDFLGWGVFDCKPAQTGCIVKIADDIQA